MAEKKKISKRGPKPRQISEDVQRIILTLIGAGDSNRRVRKITGFKSEQWDRLAIENKEFRTLLEKAKEKRDGNLASALRDSMLNQINKGHPWWAKLAIHNFNVLLKDPDVIGAAKIKRLAEKVVNQDVPRIVKMRPINPAEQ